MKFVFSGLVIVGVAQAAHAGGKPIPGTQHDPQRYLDESQSWIGAVNQGDEGYRFHASVWPVNFKEGDRVRVDWTQGGKVLATAKCQPENVDGRFDCDYRDKPMKAKGTIEAHVIYEDDQDDKEYLLRTYKFEMKQWDKVTWQIAADDLLASAYLWHGNEGQIRDIPVFRFWIASKDNSFNAQLRCTVDGTKLPDFDGSVQQRGGGDLEADIIPPKGDRQTWHWSGVEFDPDHLKFGPKKDDNATYLGEHPGNWDCQLRRSGIAVREFLFHVNDKGRVDSHPMQQAKNAYPVAPNIALIDVRIPKDNGLDQRIKPDLLRKSRGYGMPWPDDPSVKATLAALPAAYENAHPVAAKPKGSGKLVDGMTHSPPRYIDESTPEIRLTSHKEGYGFHLFAEVVGVNGVKSDLYRLEWKSGGKLVQTAKCDWGYERMPKEQLKQYGAMAKLTCDYDDKPVSAKGPIEASLIYHDDEDGNEYLVRTFKVNVAKFTSYGDPIWQIVPDDLLGAAWVWHSDGDPMDVYGQRLMIRFWMAKVDEGMNTKMALRCTVDGNKLPDIRADLEKPPGNFQVEAEPYTKDGKHSKYSWKHVQLEAGIYHGKKDRSDISEELKKANGILGEHPGKWDCNLRSDGKVIREFLFTVGDDGRVHSDLEDPKFPTAPDTVPIEVRIPKDSKWDDRIRPDAMRKSRGFGLPWPSSPSVKATWASYPSASGLPDPH